MTRRLSEDPAGPRRRVSAIEAMAGRPDPLNVYTLACGHRMTTVFGRGAPRKWLRCGWCRRPEK